MKSIFLRTFTILVLISGIARSQPIDPAKYPAPVRVACVGDSITHGSGASPGFSYPDQLQKLLGDHWQVKNFGVSARTLLRHGDHPYWKEKAFTDAQDFHPDVVIILLGTNDTKPQNWVHKDQFRQDYADLVNVFLRLPHQPEVFICYPPPVPDPGNYGINEAGVRQEIPIIANIAARLNLHVIDMHATLLHNANLLPDHVHPNNDGAGLMAKAAYRALTGKD
jgi:lysophospholipase L1-like esterase